METMRKTLAPFCSLLPLPPYGPSCFPKWPSMVSWASCFSGSVGIKSFFHFYISVSYHTWLKWISDTLKTPAAAKSLQLCLTLCDTMDCILPVPSVHGILQGRILEWVAMPSSRGSSRPRGQTCVSWNSCVASGFFTAEPFREAQSKEYLPQNHKI